LLGTFIKDTYACVNEDNKCWTLLQRCLCWKKESPSGKANYWETT